MKCGLDSIFKVGFGVELNCLEGSNQEGNAFIKAFDDSNALVYWRYVDPLWTLKRFLNIGSEASLKKSIKVMDDFVYNLIRTKRKQLSIQQYTVSIIISFHQNPMKKMEVITRNSTVTAWLNFHG